LDGAEDFVGPVGADCVAAGAVAVRFARLALPIERRAYRHAQWARTGASAHHRPPDTCSVHGHATAPVSIFYPRRIERARETDHYLRWGVLARPRLRVANRSYQQVPSMFRVRLTKMMTGSSTG
jgi:hypothetical protein